VYGSDFTVPEGQSLLDQVADAERALEEAASAGTSRATSAEDQAARLDA